MKTVAKYIVYIASILYACNCIYIHTRGVLHAEEWSMYKEMVYFTSIFTLPPVSNDTIIYKAIK